MHQDQAAARYQTTLTDCISEADLCFSCQGKIQDVREERKDLIGGLGRQTQQLDEGDIMEKASLMSFAGQTNHGQMATLSNQSSMITGQDDLLIRASSCHQGEILDESL